MKSLALKFAASSLALGLATIGTNGFTLGPVTATASEARADEQAAQLHRTAREALVRGDAVTALAAIEQAVALSPQDAGYRMMLGDVYMKNGRFRSAEEAYRDVLTLDPAQMRVALSMALMQVANGRSQEAIAQLEALEGRAPAADLGLAYALAGAPQRGVAILEPIARSMSATARVRQNLALAYAISGDWSRARTVAAQDISPAELAGRMTEWAALTRSPERHVAALIGVVPAQDPGRPVRLALNAPEAPGADATPARIAFAAPSAPIQLPPPEAMAASADSVPLPSGEPTVVSAEAPAAYAELEQPDWGIAEDGAVRLPAPDTQPLPERVQYAAAAESLVRPAPAAGRPLRRAVRMTDQLVDTPAPAVGAPRRSADGRYVVQIGAFSSADNAERAWQQAERRFGLRSEQPVTMTIDLNGRLMHRVAIAGFERRGEAATLCASIREQGGECFVRNSAGDAAIRWAARYARRA